MPGSELSSSDRLPDPLGNEDVQLAAVICSSFRWEVLGRWHGVESMPPHKEGQFILSENRLSISCPLCSRTRYVAVLVCCAVLACCALLVCCGSPHVLLLFLFFYCVCVAWCVVGCALHGGRFGSWRDLVNRPCCFSCGVRRLPSFEWLAVLALQL